jgi:hypothetical protein
MVAEPPVCVPAVASELGESEDDLPHWTSPAKSRPAKHHPALRERRGSRLVFQSYHH